MNLTINIADIPVNLALGGCDSATQAFIADHYAAFRVPYQASPITISVHSFQDLENPPAGITPLRAVKTHKQSNRIEFESYYERGWADLATGQGELVLRAKASMENFLRVLYAWLCLEQDALVLHACGVISNRRGFVFYGPSTSGKTTVARLAQNRIILSDDIVIVKKQGGKFRAYGVPFRGDYPEAPRTNDSADLAGIFILVKATEHRLEFLSVPQSVARLSASAPFVMTDPPNVQRVMRVANDLATNVPRYALHFKRDPEFWSLLDGLD